MFWYSAKTCPVWVTVNNFSVHLTGDKMLLMCPRTRLELHLIIILWHEFNTWIGVICVKFEGWRTFWISTTPMACDISIRRVSRSSVRLTLNPYKGKKVHSPNLLKEKCISEVVRIGSIIFHLSMLRKAKFSIQCDVLFLVRLQGKFEFDHSWEWKG